MIKSWLIGKLAKPLLPILEQSFRVVGAVEIAFREIMRKTSEAGIVPGTPIYKNMETILNAITIVKTAISKTIVFLGGVIPVTASGKPNLDDEIEKLKNLL